MHAANTRVYNHNVCCRMAKLILILLTLPSCRVHPRYGAIVTVVRRASFVEGHLRVKATLNQI